MAAICIERRFAPQAASVIHQLERYLNTTPLLGTATVLAEITTHGTGNAGALAGGISEALITTAAGLAVAIPSLVMHRHYTSRIESIVVDLEREAIKLVDAIHSNQKTEYDWALYRCRLLGVDPAGCGFTRGRGLACLLMLSIDVDGNMMLDGQPVLSM